MIQAQFPDEQSETGGFERQEDAFRDWVTDATGAEFTPQAGRYHLYVSLACPWAHRTVILRKLLQLESMIRMTVVDPVRDERGWAFGHGDGFSPDPVNGFRFLSQAYQRSSADYSGRVTVPVLWDREKRVIVNNSEDDICRMFAEVFTSAERSGYDLFPSALADEQDELAEFIYRTVNNGVYEAGFATDQTVYEKAVAVLFDALDVLEERLQGGEYVFGEHMVEADWRLFCTLVRFDAVYYGHFKCNMRRITDYPNLSAYLRRLYWLEGIAETVNIDHIKRHYYITHDFLNPSRIVPAGPILDFIDRS